MKPPFEAVVAAHGARVLRVCRAVIGPDEADDAWSDTFLAALSAYPDLPAEANVEAWLVTIAHRKAIDRFRSRARRAIPTDELPQRPATGGSITDRLLARDLLAGLPDKQRQVLAYHYLGGLPYAEIAEIVGGTADAARRAAADGMANLRRRLISTTLEGGKL